MTADSPLIELNIVRFANTGEGIAEYQGRSVFVPRALPGERVLVRLVEGDKVLRGVVARVVEPAGARVEAPCRLWNRCGGCDWMHLSLSEQLKRKREIVVSAMERIGGISSDQYHLSETDTHAQPASRRRAVFHIVSGRFGFNERRSHDGVMVDECIALTEPLQQLSGQLADAIGSSLIKDIEELHVLESEAQIAVSVHLKGALRDKLRAVFESLVRDQVLRGAVFVLPEGKGAPVLLGDPVLYDGHALLRPDGFAQANAEVNRSLVDHSIELCRTDAPGDLLELFSGNGNFSFGLAAVAKNVIAVESSSVSVQLAQAGLKKRGLNNVRLMQGSADDVTKGLIREKARFDVVFLDPPRTGAPVIGQWASALLAKRVVYVACDPVSLARDAKTLVAHGFRPETLQVFDLFPNTHHVESVMSFTR